MDRLNDVFKVKFIKDSKKIISKQLTRDNIVIMGLIMYISIISIYTPRHLISLINSSIVRLIILGCVLYFGKSNYLLGLFISIALIITINLDNTINVTKQEIENINEGFKNKTKTKSNKNKGNDSDSDSDSGSDSDSDSDSGSDSDENYESGSGSDSDSDSDSDSGSDNIKKRTEQFDINKLKPGKNLHDNFKTLHNAIHELESFISTKENE